MENCNILIYANCKATECGAISPAIDQCMSGLLILIVSTLVLIVSLVSGARKRSAIEIGNWEHMLSVCHNLLDASKKQKVKKKNKKNKRGGKFQAAVGFRWTMAFQFPAKYFGQEAKRRRRFRFPRTAKAQIKL